MNPDAAEIEYRMLSHEARARIFAPLGYHTARAIQTEHIKMKYIEMVTTV